MKNSKAHIIKDMIALGKTQEAISMLVSESKKLGEDFHNECNLLSSRLSNLIKGIRLEVVENAEIKLNQISLSTLQMVDEYGILKKIFIYKKIHYPFFYYF